MFAAALAKLTTASRATRITRASASRKSMQPSLIYAARVGLGYRALAVLDGEIAVWFWIGTHAEYDQLLRTL
jgi:hypothetical protein